MEFYGYIKANKLTGEYILRQDMEERGEAITIAKDKYQNRKIEIDNKKIQVLNNTLQKEEETNENTIIWGVVTNRLIENKVNSIVNDYRTRNTFIESIVKQTIDNDLKGVVLDFYKIDNKDNLKRFIIEITPRLREIGVSTVLVINENINKEDYINLVDYIVD